MAVTAPTPPTPPTPPTVPQVTLGATGNGSVTQTTAPHASQTTPEDQARNAVASGEGALSKTEKEAPPQKDGNDRTDASPAARQQGENAGQASTEQGAQQAQQTGQELSEQQQDPLPPAPQSLGIAGWAVSLLLVLAAAAVLWHLLRHGLPGKKPRERLTFSSLQEDAAAPENDGEEAQERPYSGFTVGEVLDEMEEEERAEVERARSRARAWQAKQAARALQAEQERAARRKEESPERARPAAETEPPEEQAASMIRRTKDEEGKEHFEVRV
jgi:hypothetical protein